MRRWIQKMRIKLWLWRNLDKQLNRRSSVEKYLLRAAAGKEPLPDAEKCQKLAVKLGVPDNAPGGK